MAAARTPRWTSRRVRWALTLLYGPGPTGRPVDTAAAALALGVSQRSVQKWQALPRGRVLGPGPRQRLLTAMLPSEETLAREEQAAEYARDALARIALPRGVGILTEWREQGWLEPHLVAAVQLPFAPPFGLRQLLFARVSGRQTQDLRRRGEIVDFTTVPGRFEATLLIHTTLQQMRPWRIQPRAVRLAGPTRVLAGDAPATNLDAGAALLR